MITRHEGRALLAQCRVDPTARTTVDCGDAGDGDGQWRDPNAERRYAILLALQYDLRPEDVSLVRHLVEQEALRHEREPFQGLYSALRLAGYLLASYRMVEHVWVFAQAKRANFDTFLGFDLEYLVSAGIEPTLAHVRAAESHPLRTQVEEWLVRDGAQCVFTEEDMTGWWRQQIACYPADEANEDPEARLDQALELNDLEEAQRWLAIWANTPPRTARDLQKLAWYCEQVQDWDGAVSAAAESLAMDDLDAFRRGHWQLQVASYCRRAGRPEDGWQAFRVARETLLQIAEWWRVGLGRAALEEALLLAETLPQASDDARKAYGWASEQLTRRGAATLHLLELAATVAAHRGEEDDTARFRKRAARERQRIDRELARFKDGPTPR